MAKKQKKFAITRRTLGQLIGMIPKKRRKNLELGVRDRSGVHPVRGRKSSRRKAQRKRR